MTPLISVIIPHHNRPLYVADAIASVQNQTYKNFELIVVDDNGAGTDCQLETYNLIQKLQQDKRLRYIVRSINSGGGAARNAGIEAARGEFIAFLDDDDQWKPEFLEKQLAAFEKPDIDIVYTAYHIRYDYTGKEYPQRYPQYRGFVFDKLLRGWCPTSTSLFMMRRSVFDNGILFDETLPGFQDYDCWLALAKEHQFDFCVDSLVTKRVHGTEQISFDPNHKQNALNLLEIKWRELLSEEDLRVFEDTLVFFQREIYKRNFLMARHNDGFLEAMRKAFFYLTYKKPTLREIAAVGKKMLLPYS